MKERHTNEKRHLCVLVLMAILTVSLLTACGGKPTDEPQPAASQNNADSADAASPTATPVPAAPAAAETENTAEGGEEMVPAVQPKYELYGVKYEASAGDMAYHSEFEIEVSKEEIVSCAFWPEDDDSAIEMTRKEHVPVTEEQWADIENIVKTLLPLMKKIPENVLQATPDPDMEVLDGGDYSNWSLIWETEKGFETERYYQPQDRRINTLITLLKELADPQGREIEWYAEPVILGLYFSDSKNDYSWQMTLVNGVGTGYRYITYYMENKERRSFITQVDEEVWNEAYEFISTLNLRDFPSGGYKDKYYCTLYISDNTQKGVKLDKDTAKAMREFFMEFTEKVKAASS